MKARRAADNPFRAERIEALAYRFADTDWAALEARARAQDWRGGIVGPHGSGKTTLLEQWAPRLAKLGWQVRWWRMRREDRTRRWRWREWSARRAEVEPGQIVLFDGADLLARPVFLWLRLTWPRGAGWIVSSHGPALLPLLHRCATTPALVAALACDLGLDLAPSAADELWRRHRGDVRAIWRSAYDAWAAGGVSPTDSSHPGSSASESSRAKRAEGSGGSAASCIQVSG